MSALGRVADWPVAGTARPHDRLVFGTVAAALLGFLVYPVIVGWSTFAAYVAVDYDIYMEATRRWLAGGPFYDPSQLAGPYQITVGAVLYPPSAIPLFAVFTVLPAVLWWAIPIGLIAFATWRLRPAAVTWPILVLCAAIRPTEARLLSGNPVMWTAAALAMGTLYFWPSVFVLIKPSLFPFALFGIRHRSWWVALAVLVAISLPFAALWIDWIAVVRNSNGSLDYSIPELPMMFFPLVAWWGRTRYREPQAGARSRQVASAHS